MKSGKSLKTIATENPRRIGQPENLRAVKHHLLRSDGTEQAFAADAAAKLAYTDPEAAQQIRGTLEQVADGFHQQPVRERVDRALFHIDSQIDVSDLDSSDTISASSQTGDENTRVYKQGESTPNANYCRICGTELPHSGPTNYCPGCGTELD